MGRPAAWTPRRRGGRRPPRRDPRRGRPGTRHPRPGASRSCPGSGARARRRRGARRTARSDRRRPVAWRGTVLVERPVIVAGAPLGSAGMHRTRFPGLGDGWARLDGAAGTQMVDDVIEEMAAWMRSGHSANHGGAFLAAERTDALVDGARASVARLLGASAQGIVFGPSMTALTMRFSAAACRSLQPGDEIVCTRLDHDA